MLCFHNTKVFAFPYQSAGFRDNDSNLVYTILSHRNESLIVTTYFKDNVFADPDQSVRYYRCIAKGLVSLSTYGYPDYFIIKKIARKDGRRLKRSQGNVAIKKANHPGRCRTNRQPYLFPPVFSKAFLHPLL